MWFNTYWNLILFLFNRNGRVSDREYSSMPVLFHLDDYDSCMLYEEDALYCIISFQLFPKYPQNLSKSWNIIQKVSTSDYHYKHDLLRHGVCVTSKCPLISKSKFLDNNENFIEKLSDCYSEFYKDLGLAGVVEKINCFTYESPYSFSIFDDLYAIVIVIIVLLVLYAWLYDEIFAPDFKSKEFVWNTFNKFVFSFSIKQNWRRLVNNEIKDPDAKKLSCLQGIRVFNVVIVIACHSMLVNTGFLILNPQKREEVLQQKVLEYYGFGNSYVVLETFFLISSWLITFQFLKETEGKKEVPFSFVIKKIVNRYLRLTPLMAITIGFYGTWISHFSDGPLWDFFVGHEYNLCRKNWWINILHLQNFLPLHDTCITQSWSLALDMQYYILGIFILWFSFNTPKRLFLFLGGLYIYHLIVTFYMVYPDFKMQALSPEMTYDPNTVDWLEIVEIFHSSASTIPGFLFGIIFGYIFYIYRNQNLFTNKIYVILWWILPAAIVIICSVAPGFIINYADNQPELITAYMLISRTIFSLAAGLFILGMTQGLGGGIRELCQSSFVSIFGHLSYGAYLNHTFFQRYKHGIRRAPEYVHYLKMAFDFIVFVSLAFFAAIPMTLFFEMPFKGIRSMLVKTKIKSMEVSKKVE